MNPKLEKRSAGNVIILSFSVPGSYSDIAPFRVLMLLVRVTGNRVGRNPAMSPYWEAASCFRGTSHPPVPSTCLLPISSTVLPVLKTHQQSKKPNYFPHGDPGLGFDSVLGTGFASVWDVYKSSWSRAPASFPGQVPVTGGSIFAIRVQSERPEGPRAENQGASASSLTGAFGPVT